MGQALANRNLTVAEQARLAIDHLRQLTDLDAIWDQIMLARRHDAGFRGAGPLDEPINAALPLPPCPLRGTILAADGSQIYPDPHGPAPYWLTNIGVYIYHHGVDWLPESVVEPQLYFREEDVRDADGRLIANAAINARRAVYEMQQLATIATQYAENAARPLVALYDGPLIGMPMGKEVGDAAMLTADYHEAIDFLLDVGAALAGYVDRPTSRFVVYTIFLMTLDEPDITRGVLQSAALEGLTDADLYRSLLGPGERSALMIQQSPLNKEYKDRYGDHQEIVFFYLNTASEGQDSYLARVEVPMWVARDRELVNAVHALLYSQCQITDRYPYALTRADEVTVVQPAEKRGLDELIAIELLRNRQPVESSQKLDSKNLARHGRQQHRV
ncbi:MAG: DNA double-strand break repair nuclease NurA [Anaerolineae bacterium]|nr:DNA double-strand break repair nuclease NurA [Anaerolineae bacterium]